MAEAKAEVSHEIGEMSSPKRKLTTLNIDQKIEILDALQSKTKTRKELSEQYGCDLSTIVRIVQQEMKIRNVALENGNTSRKRLRKGKYEEVEEAVAVWYHQMRAKNAAISGPMIIEEAKKFAEKLGLPDFKPSNGWLGRWKSKENISLHKPQRDKGSSEWIHNVMPPVLAEYEAKDIYNADESGLLYKELPKGTTPSKAKKAEGKTQKDRLTALFLCNMDGSDKHIFIVGPSKQSQCFQGRKIPLPYYTNMKAWMTCALWTRILQDFDRKMSEQNRKVVLFADNAPCHKLEDGVVLENVKIQILPPSTASVIQPLDQGIIRAFKVYYRQKIIRQQLLSLENGITRQKFARTITVLAAMKLIEQSWHMVTAATIQNCYRKAGFATAEEEEVEEAPIQLQIPENEFNEYVDCDANLDCYGELTVDDIVDEVYQQRNDRSGDPVEEQEAQETTPPPPSRKDALAALTVIRNYFEHMNEDLNNVNAVEDQFCDMTAVYVVQKKISDYFK